MSIKKVLTIESVDDSSTRRMLKTLYSSTEFKNYKIDHFYFLQPGEKETDSEKLFESLTKKIIEFRPDAILIHTGGYFEFNKSIFVEIIRKVKEKYPQIKFGIQQRVSTSNKNIISCLDDSDEIRELEETFFRINR